MKFQRQEWADKKSFADVVKKQVTEQKIWQRKSWKSKPRQNLETIVNRHYPKGEYYCWASQGGSLLVAAHQASRPHRHGREKQDHPILQAALNTRKELFRILAGILYKACEVLKRAIDAIIHTVRKKIKPTFRNVKVSILQTYSKASVQWEIVDT